ncbi:MAG TPA: TetR/AcrR family transcriptional regulator [Candidatus Cybelea sp.]|nr:TetR/AcrR family transcriptional regulator [Candidatus Cybelea sp.]
MPRNLSEADVKAFRDRLCRAAERRFAAHGAQGVSMRQLAAELGCAATTPYRYFADKDEILAAVRAAAFDRFAAALEEANTASGDARAKSRAVGEAYLRFAMSEPDAYRLMFDMAQPDENRFPDLKRATARARRTMTAYIEGLVREGWIKGDPKLLGYVFWAGIHGLVVLHLAGKLGGAPDFATLHRTMMRLLAEGTFAPQAAPQQDMSQQRPPRRAAGRRR